MQHQWESHILFLAHSRGQEEAHLGVEAMPDLYTKRSHLGDGQLGESMPQDVAGIEDIDLVVAGRLHQVDTGRLRTQAFLDVVAIVLAELDPIVETIFGYIVEAVVRLQARHNILPAVAALRYPGPVQPVGGLGVVAGETGGRRGRNVRSVRLRDIQLQADLVEMPLPRPFLRGGHEIDNLMRLIPADYLRHLEPAHGEGHGPAVQGGDENHMPVVTVFPIPHRQSLQEIASVADLMGGAAGALHRQIHLLLGRQLLRSLWHFLVLFLLGSQLIPGGEDRTLRGQYPAIVDGHLRVYRLAMEVRCPAQHCCGLGLLSVGDCHREIDGRGPG